MGEHVVGDVMVVTRKENFAHDITLIAVVFECGLRSEVVKAGGKRAVCAAFKGLMAVAKYGVISFFVKFKSNVATRFDAKFLLRWYDFSH